MISGISLAYTGGLSAIDHHRVPSCEGAILRAKPQNRRGDLLGLAQASHGFLSNHTLMPFGCTPAETLDHRGVDDAWANGIHADVGPRVIEGSTLGETDDTKLGGRIGCLSFHTNDASTRRGVDDGSAAMLEHDRYLVLHAQEHAAEI